MKTQTNNSALESTKSRVQGHFWLHIVSDGQPELHKSVSPKNKTKQKTNKRKEEWEGEGGGRGKGEIRIIRSPWQPPIVPALRGGGKKMASCRPVWAAQWGEVIYNIHTVCYDRQHQ